MLNLLQASDDASELSSAMTLLLQLLRNCPTTDLLACNTTSNGSGSSGGSAADGSAGVLAHVLAAARQLLSPSQPDGCSAGAGPLLAQLLKTFPSQLSSPVPAVLLPGSSAAAGGGFTAGSCVALLLHDVVVKLAAGSCSPATVASLLEFVVRLALLDVQQLLELLSSMQVQRQGRWHAAHLLVMRFSQPR